MANKPTPAPKSKEVAVEMAVIDQTMAAANQLAVATLEQNERVNALALLLNYQGSTDPAVLENSAKDAIRRIGMAVFELGGYLLLLRENLQHGMFLPTLERLGLAPRAAQQYMSVTRRFASNANSSSHLLENFGVKKLVELLVLDNEQLEDLTELGQTGELALDDLGGMSVKELRIAVRKARAEADKQKARAERQEAVNTELHEEVRLVKHLKPDEALAKIKAEAGEVVDASLGMVRGRLRQALVALNDAADHPSKLTFMAGLVAQVQAESTALRDEFNLPDAVSDDTPEWERWAQANPASTTGTAAAN